MNGIDLKKKKLNLLLSINNEWNKCKKVNTFLFEK